MKPSYRYGIIALCFVVFFVFGTALVIYTTGEVYDTATHSFVRTGIVSATTNPSGAQIFLNGKLAGTTPAHVRFLAPGTYNVRITKPGYGDWDKRLSVQGDFTTYVNSDINAVYMYKSQPVVKAVATDVQDFSASGSTFVYTTPTALVVASVADPVNQSAYAAPAGTSFSGSQLTASPNGQFVLIRTGTDATMFDVGSRKFTLLPLALPGSVQLTDSGSLHWLNGTSLGQVTWQNTAVVATPLAQNVLAFDATSQGMYIVQKNSLVFLQLPTLQPTTLRTGLPNWLSAQLYVNSQSQIFINAGGTLYSVNSGLDAVGSNVQTVLFYEQYSSALFATGNEIDLYNVQTGASQLVARTSTPISSARATPSTGAVFFIGNGELQAIEIDARDHQNSYAFASVGAGAKFYVTSDAKYVVLLDHGNLTQLQVR